MVQGSLRSSAVLSMNTAKGKREVGGVGGGEEGGERGTSSSEGDSSDGSSFCRGRDRMGEDGSWIMHS
jgi:hypothetical protein